LNTHPQLPSLATERLFLRPRQPADLPALLAMAQDGEVMHFVGGVVSDLASHERELRERIHLDFGPGLGYWSVLRQDGLTDYLGWIALTRLDNKGPEIEIGWRFARHAWGCGFATEAAQAVLGHARHLGIDPIAVIKSENVASVRVAERLGMVHQGRLHAYGAMLDRYGFVAA
jgi:RimJ/RimL family protein N-acetyltransferase